MEKELLESLDQIKQGILRLGDMLEFLLSQMNVAVDDDDGEDEPASKELPQPKHFIDIEKHRGYLG